MTLFGLSMGPSDADLVRRFSEGDRAAYSELVSRYQDRVFTLCLRWMGDRQAAEDVAQDVFLAMYRALPRFRGESKLSTWVFRVTVNHCKNRRLHNRRRAQDRHEPLEGTRPDDQGPARQLPSTAPGTDRGAQRSEAQQIIQHGLEQLDEAHRAIIVLRDIQGLAYEEIADILELPRGTVKSRLHRARGQLARVLSRSVQPQDILD